MKGINTKIKEFELNIDKMLVESGLPIGYLLSFFKQKTYQLEEINKVSIQEELKQEQQTQESEVSENGNK